MKALKTSTLSPIILLLLVAIVLPVSGIVWFMSAAVRNEQMAVRQRLSEVYESQLNSVLRKLEESLNQRVDDFVLDEQLSPSEQFHALVQTGAADSFLVLGKDGKILYPANAIGDYEVHSEATQLQSDIRALLESRSFEEARLNVEQWSNDESLRSARDESGRLMLPATQLLYLQAREHNEDTMVGLFRDVVTDYSVEMISSRRLFYLQELKTLGTEAEPLYQAELLAQQIDKVPSKQGIVVGKNMCVFFCQDKPLVVVYELNTLMKSLRTEMARMLSVEGVRLELEQEPIDAWRSVPFPLLGSSWKMSLYLQGDDPFADTADRHIMRYLWAGNMMIAGMIAIFVLLARSLLRQQRLTRMKNDFVATVTHELKTPLASSRMLVDTILEGRCRGGQQEREYLELIARENKRLSRLIDNFLTFSRMERNKRSFHFEAVPPKEIAEIAVDAIRDKFEQNGCILSVSIAESIPLITADHDAMVQVLLNLLDNACKYSDEDKRIQLSIFVRKRNVFFKVKDHGIGLAKREQVKVFDRFYQVDQSLTRSVGGTGLGLSIVSFIVHAHGGEITIESELGRGSTFTVSIPRNGEG